MLKINSNKYRNQQGNILVTTLLVMLTMNFLVLGLMQFSINENKQANAKTTDSTNFYLNESCVEEAINYIKTYTSPPQNLPVTITRNNLSHLYNGTEDAETLNQLSKYSYNCTLSSITVKSVEGKTDGTGSNVTSKDSYGTSGDLKPSYYYLVIANSLGPNNYKKTTNTIISAKF